MISFVIALALASGAPVEQPMLQGPIKMKPAQIREYNRHLPRDHPNYIRCASIEEVGSLVKRNTTCRTNQEWSRLATEGNNTARELLEAWNKGWSRGS